MEGTKTISHYSERNINKTTNLVVTGEFTSGSYFTTGNVLYYTSKPVLSTSVGYTFH